MSYGVDRLGEIKIYSPITVTVIEQSCHIIKTEDLFKEFFFQGIMLPVSFFVPDFLIT